MIQVLTYSGKDDQFKGDNVIISSIHEPRSLDEFEINIVFLDAPGIWMNNADSKDSCVMLPDFNSLSIMIANRKHTNVLIVYPQNNTYYYYKWGNPSRFHKNCELKNMLKSMTKHIIGSIYQPLEMINVMYENTQTQVGKFEIPAAFNFICGEPLLLSQHSNKSTVVKVNDIYATTLKISNIDELWALLKQLKLISDKQDAPEWLDEIKMFDDEEQTTIINDNKNIIQTANDEISKANSILDKNRHYKSILYTNSDELVSVTFEILEQLLGCDLSEFEDKKKEDFLFSLEKHVFIGEIKGVNHNIRNENVSQLDVHYQSYLDEHPEIDEENVFALLIMNHQKNKQPDLREEVHENQIKLAQRNGSLIIETTTLLKMYEMYLNSEMTREQCVNVLKNNTGLLKL